MNAIRLALGTLTVAPTRPPTRVDARVGSWAMTLAPLVGVLLAVAGGVLLWVLGWAGILPAGLGLPGHVGPVLAAALVVGLMAVLTRAIHLDGLADTVDGLGSRRVAGEALEIMRRGDVGPFGVVTLVLVLLVQVLALGQLVALGLGIAALVLALVVSRLALPLLCVNGFRPARVDALGAAVVGSVRPWQLALSAALAVVVLLPLALATVGPYAVSPSIVVRAGAVVVLALGAALLVAWRATRRLGGITGDVLGAAVETSFTTVLVLLVLAA